MAEVRRQRAGWRLALLLLALCAAQALAVMGVERWLLSPLAQGSSRGLGMLIHTGLRAALLWLLLDGLSRHEGWGWSRRLLAVLAATLADVALQFGVTQLLGRTIALAPAQLGLSRTQMTLIAVGGSLVLCGLQYLAAALLYLLVWQRRQQARWRRLAEHSQLQMLQSQLQPHFLFNALNSVRAMIFEDHARAAAMLTALSCLLRSSLERGEGLVTLDEDWALSRHYLALEGLRLDQRLRVQARLPEALLAQRLPRFALLTLTENAVKHGIAARLDGGELLIEARITGAHQWQLRVSNPLAAGAAQPGLGSGLSSLAQRLRLQSGGRLEAASEAGHFQVTLTLPLAVPA